MTFGQPSGPPAPHRQLQELLELLQAAGHTDFRDARGPMGFTQRQAAGKFTRDEATAFIERLEEEAVARKGGVDPQPESRGPDRQASPRSSRPPLAKRPLRQIPSERMADELRDRGWTVTAPEASRT